MSVLTEKVYDMAKPIIENLGYELIDVKYAKSYNGMELTLFINSSKGISLNDCEKVSKALDEPLEELNPTSDKPYLLSVSSLGLDRPIITTEDFKRNLKKEVVIKLFTLLDGNKEYLGKLVDVNDDFITLKIKSETKIIERKLISNAKLYIKF